MWENIKLPRDTRLYRTLTEIRQYSLRGPDSTSNREERKNACRAALIFTAGKKAWRGKNTEIRLPMRSTSETHWLRSQIPHSFFRASSLRDSSIAPWLARALTERHRDFDREEKHLPALIFATPGKKHWDYQFVQLRKFTRAPSEIWCLNQTKRKSTTQNCELRKLATQR